MTKRLYTAADIRTWKECGETKIELGPGDIVTPEAEDVARALKVALVRSETDPLAAKVRALVTAIESQTVDERAPMARGAQVRLVKGKDVSFGPFPFEVHRPEMNIRTVDVITAKDGSPIGAGFMSFENGSFPWTLNYDEIDYVIDGELEIRVGDESYFGHPGDVIFIPRGTSIHFCTPTYARFFYVTCPADWTAKRE